MSKYFLIAGPRDVRDITFERWGRKGAYRVRVGGEAWGVVSQDTHSGWTATSHYMQRPWLAGTELPPADDVRARLAARRAEDDAYEEGKTYTHSRSLVSVNGFASRMAAATYIIKTFGYWKNN